MSISAAGSASAGWFKPLATPSIAAGAAGAASMLAPQAKSPIALGTATSTAGASGLGTVSSQLQSMLLNLQSLPASSTKAGQAGPPPGGIGMQHHAHRGEASTDSNAATSSSSTSAGGSSTSVVDAIGTAADDIMTLPSSIGASVSQAMQSYFATSSLQLG